MLKLISVLSAVLFMFAAVPAHADWCRAPGGGVEPCGTIPSSWSDCGTFQGDTLWCHSSGNTGKQAKSKNSTKNTLIYVGIGVVFVGAMWYIFRKPPSENNPGQVKLMSF